MAEQIITSDKSLIYRYHAKPTQKEDTPDDLWCPYCQSYKKQFGRYWFCKCKQVKLSSGKSLKGR